MCLFLRTRGWKVAGFPCNVESGGKGCDATVYSLGWTALDGRFNLSGVSF